MLESLLNTKIQNLIVDVSRPIEHGLVDLPDNIVREEAQKLSRKLYEQLVQANTSHVFDDISRFLYLFPHMGSHFKLDEQMLKGVETSIGIGKRNEWETINYLAYLKQVNPERFKEYREKDKVWDFYMNDIDRASRSSSQDLINVGFVFWERMDEIRNSDQMLKIHEQINFRLDSPGPQSVKLINAQTWLAAEKLFLPEKSKSRNIEGLDFEIEKVNKLIKKFEFVDVKLFVDYLNYKILSSDNVRLTNEGIDFGTKPFSFEQGSALPVVRKF